MNAAAQLQVQHNHELADALATARDAIAALDRAGVAVIALMANGRRPLLMVDRMPDGVVSVIKRQSPNGQGGTTVIRAAQWNGCQLEAMHDRYPDAVAGSVTVGNFGKQ